MGNAIGDAADHHPAIAVPAKHNVLETRPIEELDHVLDVHAEVDRFTELGRPVREPRERHGHDAMTL
jgi:hypothetical protein